MHYLHSYCSFSHLKVITLRIMSRETDEMYMRRCLQLAANGMAHARPNPMVGSVIVCDGRIIGEGWHRRCGEAHAEVNAFASVSKADESLLPNSTVYVSLEPCAHYGKTPPCADLIVSKGVKRVVVGCVDTFDKVEGRGIRKLRDAGIDVTVGVLEEECLWINRRFFTYHQQHRPYVLLKWCQSQDGYLDQAFSPCRMSSDYTSMLCHKLRAEEDAILVGRVTDERDHPQLNVRQWHGADPMRLVIDRRHPCFSGLNFSQPVIPQLLDWLYSQQVQSLIVEGGANTLKRFIDSGLWDEIRVETVPLLMESGTQAPLLPNGLRERSRYCYDQRIIVNYVR